jgi:glycosyltransferase involved in cell wall biosynthesis
VKNKLSNHGVPSDLRVVFLGADVSKSGAPMLLLHFVRWLRSHTSVPFGVVSIWEGALSEDFRSVAPTMALHEDKLWMRLSLRFFRTESRKAVRRALRRSRLLRFVRRQKANLIYANTVAVAPEVKVLADAGYPILWHIHEMSFNIAYSGGRAFRENLNCAARFIAASHPVKQSLVSDMGVPACKIDVVHEFIEPPNLDRSQIEKARDSLRREMKIAPDAFVVGMCGAMDWRKGVDLFPILVKHLFSQPCSRRVHVVWIGGDWEGIYTLQMRHDLSRLGLEDRVHITGFKANPLEYMATLDAFALTSREDPFPLAMLEAAAFGLPVVCFAQSGGAVEFVGDDAGRVVDYLDVAGMAEALIELANDPIVRTGLGERARKKVLDTFTSEHQAPKLFEILNAMTSSDSLGSSA